MTPARSMPTASASSASSTPRTRWSAAACCSTSRASAAFPGSRTAKASPTTNSINAPRTRTSRSVAATSSSCAPAKWSAACGKELGHVCRRRCARRQIRKLLLVPGEGDRRDLLRHLGRRGRPNETKDVNQPWHWVVIPAMGLTMGEMFYVKELAEDCGRRRHLRVFLLRLAAHHHRRHRLAAQPAGDQVDAASVSLSGRKRFRVFAVQCERPRRLKARYKIAFSTLAD